MKPPKIRAHHLLCAQGFKGLGYDEREGEIRKMDGAVLWRAGLEKGKAIRDQDALKSVNREIRGRTALEICGGCEWKKDCLWFMRKTDEK